MSVPSFEGFHLVPDGVRVDLVLDRPERRNPLSTATLLDLGRAAEWLDDRPGVRVVVVRGLGPSFCGGADLANFTGRDARPEDAGAAGRRMADAIEQAGAVYIAQIHGHCVGGGLVLAAACDLRVATNTATFSIPEVDLGIPLAWGGIHRLVREIGPARTKELVMTCRPFDAGEAGAIGFLNRVVDDTELASTVDELAALVAAKPELPITTTKSSVNEVTRDMVGLDRSASDDGKLAAAFRDPESREAAAGYLSRFGR